MNEYEALLEIAEQELDELRDMVDTLQIALAMENIGQTVIALTNGQLIFVDDEDSLTEDSDRYVLYKGNDRYVIPKGAVVYIKEQNIL